MICVSVTKIEQLNDMDVLLVGFDDGTTAYWFYNEALAMDFLNKEVVVSFRNDMYKGNIVSVINTFVQPSKVNVVDRRENVRLFVEQEDNQSNLSFNDMVDGETKTGCLYYCVASQLKTSDKSVWLEMRIRDKSMRIATLRVFNPTTDAQNLAGKYCQSSLTRSVYGFQTKEVFEATGECPRNPEIDIAKDFVTSYFADDVSANAFMTAVDFMNKMEQVIDYEPGYGLVRMAMELSMCEQLYNVTNSLDVKLMEYAILTSRAHYCTNMQFSDEVCNVILTIRCKWPNAVKLVAMLDPGTIETRPDEYAVLCRIRDTVSTILEKKKEYK